MDAVQHGPCTNRLGPSLAGHEPGDFSPDSETESGEASSDDSDASEGEKLDISRTPQQHRVTARKFESLSTMEEEIISERYTRTGLPLRCTL